MIHSLVSASVLPPLVRGENSYGHETKCERVTATLSAGGTTTSAVVGVVVSARISLVSGGRSDERCEGALLVGFWSSGSGWSSSSSFGVSTAMRG